MSLPTPRLDNLKFQSLVDEAKRRLIQYCPEWTEYNVSDPGVTLIELFAWMTELLAYRLNRTPEINYIKFMELVGVRLQPASSARVELTFYLSVPFPINPDEPEYDAAVVPQGTEVATRQTDEDDEVVFTTDGELVIAPPGLRRLRRKGDPNTDYLHRLRRNVVFEAFSTPPHEGDTFYLGFDPDQDISGRILQLNFECKKTEGVGIKRSDPPLAWECSMGNGEWRPIYPSTRSREKDSTGGLNNPRGRIVFYLPSAMKADWFHDDNAYWIRCRLEPKGPDNMYKKSPLISNITAQVLGGATGATHAVVVRDEQLGKSDGEPGQIFHLQYHPILALQPDETVEVEEQTSDGRVGFVSWQCVADFANSDRFDRHFSLDTATGEVQFGPAIDQPDGSVRSYGRVPGVGCRIRISQYRHGGGVKGNVPAGRIQMPKSTIPYIDRVTNLSRAEGGRNPESLEEAKMRASRELQAQQRAVTARDYENLTKNASRTVARVKCRTSVKGSETLAPGTIELLVVPAAFDSLKAGDLTKLAMDDGLKDVIIANLDQYRLLCTTLRVKEPSYMGVKAYVKIIPNQDVWPDVVRADVIKSLDGFITPLALGGDDHQTSNGRQSQKQPSEWSLGREGWPFGQDLYVAEVYSLVQQVPGVKHILEVRLDYRPVNPSREQPPPLIDFEESPSQQENVEQAVADEILTPVERGVIKVPDDTLLCSLKHEVEIAGADGMVLATGSQSN